VHAPYRVADVCGVQGSAAPTVLQPGGPAPASGSGRHLGLHRGLAASGGLVRAPLPLHVDELVQEREEADVVDAKELEHPVAHVTGQLG